MSFRISCCFILILAAGCGQNDGGEKKIVVELPVLKDKDQAPPKTEKKELAKKEEPRPKLVPIDLRSYGLFGLVDAPAGASVHQNLTGEITIVGPDAYGLIIKSGALELAKIKKELLKPDEPASKALIDEAEALLVESKSAGQSRFKFGVNVLLAGQTYGIEGAGHSTATLAQVRRNFEAARSLRQTPALAQAKKDHDAAENEFTKLGGTFNTLPDGSRQIVFYGNSPLTDKDLERLPLLPELSQVVLHVKDKLTAAGLLYLDGMPRLSRLSLAGDWVNSQVVRKAGELTGLRDLRIVDAPITDFNLRSLDRLSDLEELDLSGTRIGNSGLDNLKPLKKLKYLVLARTDVTDKGMAFLKEFNDLRELSLADTAVTDAGLIELADLAKLSKLDLSESFVSNSGVETLLLLRSLWQLFGNSPVQIERSAAVDEPPLATIAPPVPIDRLPPAKPIVLVEKLGGKMKRDDEQIVSISLEGSKATDTDLGELRSLKTLQALNLENCSAVTSAGLPYLAGLTGLEELNLRGTKVTGDGVVHLKGLTKLRKLLLPPTTVLTGRQLAVLAELPNLEVVSFTLPAHDYPALAVLSRMTNLKELSLDGVVLTNRKMDYLKGLTNLEMLSLGRAGGFSDRGLDCLKGMTKLKLLVARNYQGSNKGLGHLKVFENLKVLDLDGPFINDQGIYSISALQNLEQLRLNGVNMGDAAMGAFRNLGHLIELGVSATRIGDRGLDALADSKDLEILDLSYTKVTDAGLAKLKDLNELRSLRLDGTTVNGSGLKALGDLKHLYRLMLYGTKVNDTGAAAIADISSLLSLDLGRTFITDDGLMSLKRLRSLKDLNLADCQLLTNEAVRALKEFRSLERVVLRGTNLSKAAIDDLRKSGLKVDWSGK